METETLAQGAPAVPSHSCSSPSTSMWVSKTWDTLAASFWATPADGKKSRKNFSYWALSKLQIHKSCCFVFSHSVLEWLGTEPQQLERLPWRPESLKCSAFAVMELARAKARSWNAVFFTPLLLPFMPCRMDRCVSCQLQTHNFPLPHCDVRHGAV